MAVRQLTFYHHIFIEKESLQFSPEAFSGCMAHEFAHIVLDGQKNIFIGLWELLKGSKDENTQERSADRLVIERGLGQALLKFHDEHGKTYKAYKASEGLTKQEIGALLKKQNLRQT